MKTKNKKINLQSNIFIRPILVTIALLLIPVFGNIFADGWNWGPIDFLTMGFLLFLTGLIIEVANKKIINKNFKIVAIAGVILTLLIIWIELATDGVSRWMGIMFG
jgi:hypothetical protein